MTAGGEQLGTEEQPSSNADEMLRKIESVNIPQPFGMERSQEKLPMRI